jgi:hypothetical protein
MTYGTVKLLDWTTGLEVDSGELFLGTIMGDHCKTGINTMLNTGTVCGVSSIVVGAGFPARGIPSFKWSQAGSLVDYRLEKAIVDMRAAGDKHKADIAALTAALPVVDAELATAAKALADAVQASVEKRAVVTAKQAEVDAAGRQLDALQGIQN